MSKLVGRLCRICGKGGKDDEVKEHEKRCSMRDASTSPEHPSSPKTPSGPSSRTPPETSSKTPLGAISKTSSRTSPGTQKGPKEKQTAAGIKTPTTQKSEKRIAGGKRTLDTTPIYSPCRKSEKDSLPVNAVRRNSPKQAWNARLPEGVPGKLENPFPATKSFRYYPIACEFCPEIFPPGTLRKHVQKYHPEAHLPLKSRGRVGGKIQPSSPEDVSASGTQSAGGIPKHLKVCYICGGMFGSMSLPIHEPKCLERWRLENNNLPPNKRGQEPVKLSISDLESG